MNLIKVKEMKIYLTTEKMEEIKQDPINGAMKISEKLGYNAVSKEIQNNRRPKDNFKYMIKGLNSFLDLTEEDQKIVKEVTGKMEAIAKLLPLNTPSQLNYLRLKQNYENATFHLSEQYVLMDSLGRVGKEERKKQSEKLDHLEFKFKNTRDKLDNYVMEILS